MQFNVKVPWRVARYAAFSEPKFSSGDGSFWNCEVHRTHWCRCFDRRAKSRFPGCHWQSKINIVPVDSKQFMSIEFDFQVEVAGGTTPNTG